MKQEVTLTRFALNESGSVEIEADWNGALITHVYPDLATLASDNVDLLVAPEDARRWLLFYLLATGTAAADLGGQVGRKLVVDVRPAVQQTISLV